MLRGVIAKPPVRAGARTSFKVLLRLRAPDAVALASSQSRFSESKSTETVLMLTTGSYMSARPLHNEAKGRAVRRHRELIRSMARSRPLQLLDDGVEPFADGVAVGGVEGLE